MSTESRAPLAFWLPVVAGGVLYKYASRPTGARWPGASDAVELLLAWAMCSGLVVVLAWAVEVAVSDDGGGY